MSENELDAWEESIGFYSMRRHYNKIRNELAESNSPEEFNTLISKYSKFIMFDDNSVIELYDNILSNTISNTKGQYYITGILNIENPGYKTIVIDPCEENVNLALQAQITIEEKGIYVIKNDANWQKSIQCNREQSEFNIKSGNRVNIWFRVIPECVAYNIQGSVLWYSRYKYEYKLWRETKNWFGNWVSRKSQQLFFDSYTKPLVIINSTTGETGFVISAFTESRYDFVTLQNTRYLGELYITSTYVSLPYGGYEKFRVEGSALEGIWYEVYTSCNW